MVNVRLPSFTLIYNFYICPECGYGVSKPIMETKVRRIQRCPACKKVVTMKVPKLDNVRIE